MNSPHLPALVYSIMEERDREEALALLTEAFCSSDPIEAALGIDRGEFRPMLELELLPALPQRTSLIAREAESGRAVAALVTLDALTPPVDSRGRISAKFEPIGALAADFHDGYVKRRQPPPGSCLYIFVIGVRADFVGRRLAQSMIAHLLPLARQRGYRSAFAITTSAASRRTLERHGFTTIRTQDYASYEYQGRRPFASIKNEPVISLVELKNIPD